ncbi:MAG: UDP-N-acetylmuramoyl-tripeptide--D-alanyl-D-alanine ligase [Magnetococcales bacterium]|nr:UDP-N-acetylmuramoyl-tripeptide--D-alanyl-D-alanine ligase [Magnetococcales bacterium]
MPSPHPVLNLEFICRHSGGRLCHTAGQLMALPLTGVSIDSRTLRPGELFVAIVGDHFDGHDFIAQAVAAGCGALLLSRPLPSPSLPVVQVDDTITALAQLASAWRTEVDPITVAITGSSGKTTVKEMVALCLQQRWRTHATKGNLNNHLGVPLTLLAMPADCQALVVEMGMSAAGEIAALARLAQPRVGVITSIAPAHLAHFPGGVTDIARAKGELLAALPDHDDALAIIPAGTPFTDLWRSMARSRLYTVGDQSMGGDGCFSNHGTSWRFEWYSRQESLVLDHLPPMGGHIAHNMATAAMASRGIGVSLVEIGRGLQGYRAGAGRGRQHQAAGGWTVIDDSYNANPGSMGAALAALRDVAPPGHRVAVLGDMLELGPDSSRWHADLLATIQQCAIDRLWLAGTAMAALYEAVRHHTPIQVYYEQEPAAWLGRIAHQLHTQDWVLVKGSRGLRMERIVADLIKN